MKKIVWVIIAVTIVGGLWYWQRKTGIDPVQTAPFRQTGPATLEDVKFESIDLTSLNEGLIRATDSEGQPLVAMVLQSTLISVHMSSPPCEVSCAETRSLFDLKPASGYTLKGAWKTNPKGLGTMFEVAEIQLGV